MTINCLGQLVDLAAPRVMGILNVTPDSFYDGGKFADEKSMLLQAEKMLREGADFIDIGAYSSKPNVHEISEETEMSRLLPAIGLVLKHFPDTLISADTFRSRVAKAAVETGAALINDISAGILDERMIETVASLHVPYIMMHMKGTPQTMQSLACFENIVKEILFYFSERIAEARGSGITDLIIDPGFGFAKTIPQNYEVLQKLELLQMAELPILVGVSRKSMVYKPLESSSKEALNGTTVVNTIALTKGAKILRVHDVREAVECVKLFSMIG